MKAPTVDVLVSRLTTRHGFSCESIPVPSDGIKRKTRHVCTLTGRSNQEVLAMLMTAGQEDVLNRLQRSLRKDYLANMPKQDALHPTITITVGYSLEDFILHIEDGNTRLNYATMCEKNKVLQIQVYEHDDMQTLRAHFATFDQRESARKVEQIMECIFGRIPNGMKSPLKMLISAVGVIHDASIPAIRNMKPNWGTRLSVWERVCDTHNFYSSAAEPLSQVWYGYNGSSSCTQVFRSGAKIAIAHLIMMANATSQHDLAKMKRFIRKVLTIVSVHVVTNDKQLAFRESFPTDNENATMLARVLTNIRKELGPGTSGGHEHRYYSACVYYAMNELKPGTFPNPFNENADYFVDGSISS